MADFISHPQTPFPVGVEYYRAPIPKQEVWDEDFARIRAAGLRIVRSFSYWNWMEPRPGQYELSDFDLLFDLAEKHDLYVWLDITLATHGACPEWLTREHPDIRAVDRYGQPFVANAHAAYPQGGMLHCYDHPAWRHYGGDLLRHVIGRYKDRPNLLVWGLWDGVSPISTGESYPCYCAHTLALYKAWLRRHFSLDELNERFLRRYRRWEDVEPPRDNNNVVEMLMYRRYHRQNLVEQLRWMVEETRKIDPRHELRAHAGATPRPWDEDCAGEVDSWGMSMPSNNLLTAADPYRIAERAFSFDVARALGNEGRWWNEEIYAGMARGGVVWKKQSDPRELTMLLWMTLVGGAAGCMFWQYRPEYLSFESPGYNLAALDGGSTPRLEAVVEVVRQIDGLWDYLPLQCPQAQVGIVYHPDSQMLFDFNGEAERYNADLRGVYRALWQHGIAADVLTANMDWSGYRLVFLPNVALMDKDMKERIERTLDESSQTRLIAEGSFGLYAADGQSSYGPPEGLGERLGVRVADFSQVTEYDIAQGRNKLTTPYGEVEIATSCGYAVLEPQGESAAIAALGEEAVAVRSGDGRFTWYGLTLSAGFGDVGVPEIVLGLAQEAGVEAEVETAGDRVITAVRRSRAEGWLVFVFNFERRAARANLRPRWQTEKAQDVLAGTELELRDGSFGLAVEPWSVAVVHCTEV